MHEAEIMENGQNGSARTFTSHFKDKQTTAIMNKKKTEEEKSSENYCNIKRNNKNHEKKHVCV